MFCYSIKNIQNGKRYIGITSRDVNIRFREHINHSLRSHSESKFHLEILKDGEESFFLEFIKDYSNQCDWNELCEIEQFYIKKFNSVKNGYNTSLGGDGRLQGKYCSVNQYDIKNMKLINSFNSILKASKETKIPRPNISNCANGKIKTAEGFIWKLSRV